MALLRRGEVMSTYNVSVRFVIVLLKKKAEIVMNIIRKGSTYVEADNLNIRLAYVWSYLQVEKSHH